MELVLDVDDIEVEYAGCGSHHLRVRLTIDSWEWAHHEKAALLEQLEETK